MSLENIQYQNWLPHLNDIKNDENNLFQNFNNFILKYSKHFTVAYFYLFKSTKSYIQMHHLQMSTVTRPYQACKNAGNWLWLSHVNCRGPGIWALTYCLPWYRLAGSWTQDWSQDSTSYPIIWSASTPVQLFRSWPLRKVLMSSRFAGKISDLLHVDY